MIPSFSLLTVSYNSVDYIEEALQSVASQSIMPDQYIIVDGGSTDGTLDVVSKYKDIVTLIVSESDDGIYHAMNKGLWLATSEYFGILNSDDVLFDRDVISDLKKASYESPPIIYGNIRYRARESLDIVRDWRTGHGQLQDFEKGWHPPHTGFFAKTSLCKAVGGFDQSMEVAADFDFMLKVFSEAGNKEAVWLNRYICLMREGGLSGESFRSILKGNNEIRRSLRSHGLRGSLMYTIKRLGIKVLGRIRGYL